jgi:polyhydroxyalkanoate synthesis repressor PhaR
MSEPIVIKRYSNRKLYDTSKSCYVTLKEVAEDIRNNVNIVVLDNKTNKDITAKTLLKQAVDEILEGIENEENYVTTDTMKDFLKELNINNLETILKKVA